MGEVNWAFVSSPWKSAELYWEEKKESPVASSCLVLILTKQIEGSDSLCNPNPEQRAVGQWPEEGNGVTLGHVFPPGFGSVVRRKLLVIEICLVYPSSAQGKPVV